jgi:hypothetical protein
LPFHSSNRGARSWSTLVPYESVFGPRQCSQAANHGGHLAEPFATRRDLLLTSLLAALPLNPSGAAASPLNPAQTIIKTPDALRWETQPSFPKGSADICPLTGDSTAPGLYSVLIRWHPGYMSAPHTYDRSVLRRSLGQLVGQQRRRFRPRFVRPCACRQPRASHSQNSALRRGHPQPESAGSHRDLRYRSSQLRARRSIETPLASRVIDDSQLRCDLIFTEASQLGSRSRTVLRRRYWSTQRGTVKRTSAPCGARGATHKRPPWASTIDRQMASPMPSPSGFVVKKG